MCCRVVLVGDPQQLPATVLSRQAQLANMERSMFERWACFFLFCRIHVVYLRLITQNTRGHVGLAPGLPLATHICVCFARCTSRLGCEDSHTHSHIARH